MPEGDALKALLTRNTLQQLAGSRSFERGEGYFASGEVVSLVEHAGKLTATVQGSEDYSVTLSIRDSSLNHTCNCPMGADGVFCKHCVAVGLAWIAGSGKKSRASKSAGAGAGVTTLEDARGWLGQQDKAKLVEMILDQAATDTRLRERLLLQAAKATGGSANVDAIRQAIDRATRTGGFIHYRSAHDFSRGIDQVVASMADLLQAGHASEVVELTEHGLEQVEQATLQMDDSDGYMNPDFGSGRN